MATKKSRKSKSKRRNKSLPTHISKRTEVDAKLSDPKTLDGKNLLYRTVLSSRGMDDKDFKGTMTEATWEALNNREKELIGIWPKIFIGINLALGVAVQVSEIVNNLHQAGILRFEGGKINFAPYPSTQSVGEILPKTEPIDVAEWLGFVLEPIDSSIDSLSIDTESGNIYVRFSDGDQYALVRVSSPASVIQLIKVLKPTSQNPRVTARSAFESNGRTLHFLRHVPLMPQEGLLNISITTIDQCDFKSL